MNNVISHWNSIARATMTDDKKIKMILLLVSLSLSTETKTMNNACAHQFASSLARHTVFLIKYNTFDYILLLLLVGIGCKWHVKWTLLFGCDWHFRCDLDVTYLQTTFEFPCCLYIWTLFGYTSHSRLHDTPSPASPQWFHARKMPVQIIKALYICIKYLTLVCCERAMLDCRGGYDFSDSIENVHTQNTSCLRSFHF